MAPDMRIAYLAQRARIGESKDSAMLAALLKKETKLLPITALNTWVNSNTLAP